MIHVDSGSSNTMKAQNSFPSTSRHLLRAIDKETRRGFRPGEAEKYAKVLEEEARIRKEFVDGITKGDDDPS